MYLHIKLSRFLRIGLSGIHEISIDFTQGTPMLIVGTNGCGKSSLVSEISPLPAVKTMYGAGGSKYVELSLNGHHYVVRTEFDKNRHAKHYFKIDDGDELNPGGTAPVQLALVKEHLGYTPEIHRLLHGVEAFCSMPPARRKEMLVDMCPADYGYAIRLHSDIKASIRDEQGVIRTAKKALLQELSHRLDETQISELQLATRQTKDLADMMMSNRVKPTMTAEGAAWKVRKALDDLKEPTRQLSRLVDRHTGLTKSASHYAQLEQEHLAEFKLAASKLQTITKQILDIQDRIHILSRSNGLSLSEHQEQARITQQEIDTLSMGLMSVTIEDPAAAYNCLVENQAEMFSILEALPPNHERKYGRAYYDQAMQAHAKAKLDISNLLSRIEHQKERIEHLKAHLASPNAQCPACDHKFSLAVSPKELTAAEQTLTDLRQRLPQLEAVFEQTEKDFAFISEFMTQARKLADLMRHTQGMKGYWDALIASEQLHENPHAVSVSWSEYIADAQARSKIRYLQGRQAERQKIMDAISGNDNTSVSVLQDMVKSLEAQALELTDLSRDHAQRSEIAKKNAQAVEQIIKTEKEVYAKLEALQSTYFQAQHANWANAFEDAISSVMSELAGLEARLLKVNNHAVVIQTLEQQIAQAQSRLEHWQALESALSPSEGLIGKGLYGFIKVFANEINTAIQDIWTYPMQILPCAQKSDEFELDYMFPLRRGFGNMEDAKDVSEGSTGMKEIINLAFRVVVARFYKLTHWPLILDEFGAGFDPAHRVQVAHLIQALQDHQVFQQMFIISHHTEIIEAMKDADVLVLDPTNLVLPVTKKPVNHHAIMK